MNNLLEICNLSKAFPGFQLKDISLTVPPGYIMGLIGPNGSGKTTLIKLILNMLHRNGGSVLIDGQEMLEAEKESKQKIGVVFDTHCFCEDWSLEDIERAISPFYRAWERDTYRRLTEDFGLPRKLPVKSYSRGMQVKLMLACALSHNAKLLILDEPTSGLDPAARNDLLTILSDYIADGTKSILFSTHITSDLERIADYITFIQYGRLLYSGGKDEFIDNFRRIAGGKGELNDEQRRKIIGYREGATGFEGMIKTYNAATFPMMQIEPLHIEDILIFGNMEGQSNE